MTDASTAASATTEPPITPAMREAYERTFLVIAGVFFSALVTCNLIFKKFFIFELPLLGGGDSYAFIQSVGILPYPLTFLATDLLSEIYGRRRANRVVLAGVAAALFSVLTLHVADWAPAVEGSAVSDGVFQHVFGQAWAAILASMTAYLAAQFMDIRLFHYWRRRTRGRHLWLRNNASTITSQVLDTTLVLCVLVALQDPSEASVLEWSAVPGLAMNGILFKWLVAAVDTPVLYAAVALCRRRFGPLIDQAHRADLEFLGPKAVAPGGESGGNDERLATDGR